jgi:hypothetical protein
VRLRERDGERKKEVEMEGKREMGNIQRAMLMLCSECQPLAQMAAKCTEVLPYICVLSISA